MKTLVQIEVNTKSKTHCSKRCVWLVSTWSGCDLCALFSQDIKSDIGGLRRCSKCKAAGQ